jgi:Leucine-rich repeat (LRR) protein
MPLFSFQRNLKEIHLNYNQLFRLDGLSSLIINNKQLNTIMLQNNKIEEINPFTIVSFKKIDRFSFEKNPCSIDMKNCKIFCNDEKEIEMTMEIIQNCEEDKTILKQEIKHLKSHRKFC